MKKLLLIAAFLVAGFWQYDQNRVVEQADGVVAKSDPIQRDLKNARVFKHDGYSFTPLAELPVTHRYREWRL